MKFLNTNPSLSFPELLGASFIGCLIALFGNSIAKILESSLFETLSIGIILGLLVALILKWLSLHKTPQKTKHFVNAELGFVSGYAGAFGLMATTGLSISLGKQFIIISIFALIFGLTFGLFLKWLGLDLKSLTTDP